MSKELKSILEQTMKHIKPQPKSIEYLEHIAKVVKVEYGFDMKETKMYKVIMEDLKRLYHDPGL